MSRLWSNHDAPMPINAVGETVVLLEMRIYIGKPKRGVETGMTEYKFTIVLTLEGDLSYLMNYVQGNMTRTEFGDYEMEVERL